MKENNYDFRKRLLEVHKANRRDYGIKPLSSEVMIDNGRIILLNEQAGRVLVNAARDLADYLLVSMGVSVSIKRSSVIQAEYAQGCYYLEDIMNLASAPILKEADISRKSLFSPRMTHSGYGLDMFTEAHLSAIAHAGMDAILVFTKAADLTPQGYMEI